MFAILKSLAQLLNPRFGTIHPVDTLHSTKHGYSYLKDKYVNLFWHTLLPENTLILSALLSISDVHFRTMKGMLSGLLFAACVKSIPKRCRRPCSFLCPHWMARVSRHFLWQAREHCKQVDTHPGMKIIGFTQFSTRIGGKKRHVFTVESIIT